MTRSWVKLALIGMICAAAANADHKPGHEGVKGMTMGGSAEAGWNMNFNGPARASHFLVDNAAMWMNYEVSDKLKFVVSNAFAIGDSGGLAGGGTLNTATYYSMARISGGATGQAGFVFANNGAYMEHKCADGLTTAIGHFMNPFGMESLNSRFDMPTYYYSGAFNYINSLGWTYDVGFKWTATDYLPGTAELSIVDGHRANVGAENRTPSAAFRWWYEMKSGDFSFTPVVSTFLGRWDGGPKDLGFTAGGMFKSGTLWANAEWVYGSRETAANVAGRNKTWSLYVEPGVDLGMANLSAKWDFVSQNNGAASDTTDMNLGAALTKSYSDKLRIRLTYMFNNISKKLAANSSHDVRLLFGTKW